MKILRKINLLVLLLLMISSCSLFRSDRENYNAILKRNPDWVNQTIKHDTTVVVFNKIDTLKTTEVVVDTAKLNALVDSILTFSKDTIFINKVKTVAKYAKNPICIKDTIKYVTDSVSLKIWQNTKGITYSLIVNKQTAKVITKTITINNKPIEVKETYKYYAILLLIIISLLLYIMLKK